METRMTLGRAVRSELVRLRRSPLVPLHLALAVSLGLGAGAYFGATPTWDARLGADAFFQLLGAGAPLLCGLSCGLAADAEREAGDYANLMGTPSRRCALAAKAGVLLVLGVLSAALSAALFCGITAACGRVAMDGLAAVAAVAGVAAGSVALYALMLAVALRFGRNAAIGLGAIGFMVAIGTLGGLANGLVTGTLVAGFSAGLAAAVPFAWPARLASIVVELPLAEEAAAMGGVSQVGELTGALALVGSVCAVVTVAAVVLALALAHRFERVYHAGE